MLMFGSWTVITFVGITLLIGECNKKYTLIIHTVNLVSAICLELCTPSPGPTGGKY